MNKSETLEVLDGLRKQLLGMWPDDCCKKTTITAAGKTEPACATDCPWQELARLVAVAMVEAGALLRMREILRQPEGTNMLQHAQHVVQQHDVMAHDLQVAIAREKDRDKTFDEMVLRVHAMTAALVFFRADLIRAGAKDKWGRDTILHIDAALNGTTPGEEYKRQVIEPTMADLDENTLLRFELKVTKRRLALVQTVAAIAQSLYIARDRGRLDIQSGGRNSQFWDELKIAVDKMDPFPWAASDVPLEDCLLCNNTGKRRTGEDCPVQYEAWHWLRSEKKVAENEKRWLEQHPIGVCGIPARTLPPCDLEWGHDGDQHGSAGDGFYARDFDAEHHRRQQARASVGGDHGKPA